MPIDDDVLVVGGGLAGMTAALAAARALDDRVGGGSVRIVSRERSTLRQASGLVDVLGYPDSDGSDVADDTPVVDPFDAISDLPGEHPYSVVGVEAVRAGLALFDEVVGEAYRGGHTDANALVPTVGGTVKPTARYPAGVAPGLASDGRDALLVGFESLPDFDAPLAAAHLRAAGVPFDVRGVTVQFPGDFRADAAVTRLAEALDRDESVAGEGATVREALAERVAGHLDGEARVGFPAVLGRRHPVEVRRVLSESLDAAVFEVPGGPPSVPGLRLESLFRDALADAGVELSAGDPVVDYEADPESSADCLARVLVDREGRTVPYAADAVVLATGGLVGKGVESDREAVREPVFDCNVPHADDRDDWYDDEPFGDHPFARFGVAVSDDLRPLAAGGDPEFGNLYAAGSVLGSFDFAAEKSGSGVSLATGLVAGRNAAAMAATGEVVA